MNPSPEFSVILAEAIDNLDLAASLAAIEQACAGIPTEVLVVRPAGRAALPVSGVLAIREIIAPEASLVPDRWGLGVLEARGPLFACLTTELCVHTAWAAVLRGALGPDRGETVGASGAIALAPAAGMVATAVYFVRFNAFLPGPGAGSATVEQIPGDSAVYRRDAVLAHPDLLAGGFWEAEFHRRFRAAGQLLRRFDQPLASFTTAIGLPAAVAVRARHARDYGATRVSRYGESRTRLLLAAPLVPLVLLFRMLQRAAKSKGLLWPAMRTLPALFCLTAAWASGEAIGAMRGTGEG